MKNFPRELIHDSGVAMTLDPTRLLLAFKERQSSNKIEPSLRSIGLSLEGVGGQDDAKSSRPMQVINHTEQRFWVRSASGGPLDDNILAALDQLSQPSALEWLGPVYQHPNIEGRVGMLCPLPHVLIVKPTAEARNTGGAFADLLATFGLKADAVRSKYLGEYLYCMVGDPRQSSAYELQPKLLEEKRFVAEARFENMPMIVPTAVIPNDTFWAQQWGMTQVNAPGGWDITSGANTVVVCVLDQGCDLTHPDLAPFASPGIRLDTMGPDGSPTGNHGTACGGIVAARFNNGLGVAGLAGGCRILPVAFVNWTDVEVAAGINYAAASGAKVISMSFGWNAWSHPIIDPAIQNASNADVVMCVATHNYNGPITYPATNPLVLACGASDQIDNRKSPTSPDGETWWGSDFGPEISVVAPGVRIPTTDRQGVTGYNTAAGTAGDYFMMFNGTSSATPHVAGLAALIRSQYPALTNVQVRSIIERTADKVGVVPYAATSGHPNGTWNQEMGYGRINVLRALTPLPTCESIVEAQNAYLSRLCAKKVNLLSCRCSGCATDDKYPVISAPSDAPLFNTSYNGSGGFLTSGTDSHWDVGLGDKTGFNSVTSWIKAFVCNPGYQNPYSNANWISYWINAAHPSGTGNVDAYFRFTFNLGSSVDPTTFALAMEFFADNRVWEIYVNGVPQSTQPNGSGVIPQFPNLGQDIYEAPGFYKGNQVHIALDNHWRRCENELVVHVKSTPGLLGFLAWNSVEVKSDESGCDCHCDCVAVKFPSVEPCITVSWGDSKCDCLETDDVEVLCVTVCNCYSNVTFGNLSIGQIRITDMAGNPVPNLPDGTPSIRVIPSGPICFGNVGPCTDKDHPSCVSREVVLHTRGAIGKNYRLAFGGICFSVCHQFQSEQCFTMKLCQD